MTDPLDTLTCRDCGRSVKRHPSSGQLIHAGGGSVAACDLDADHPPRPDWTSVATVLCAICATPAHALGPASLTHLDAALDGDHPPAAWPPPKR